MLGLTVGSAIYAIIKLLEDDDYFDSDLAVIIFFGIVLLIAAIFTLFTYALFFFHAYLILTGQTTNEFLKNNSDTYIANPFSGTIVRNLKKFCTSQRKKGHLKYVKNHQKPKEDERALITRGMQSDKGSQEQK